MWNLFERIDVGTPLKGPVGRAHGVAELEEEVCDVSGRGKKKDHGDSGNLSAKPRVNVETYPLEVNPK